LNPLVVKEALSWKRKILMYKLHTYSGNYDDHPLITFLEVPTIIETNAKLLEESVAEIANEIKEKKKKLFKTKIVHIVSLFDDTEFKSIDSISKLASDDIEYTIHFNPPTKELPNIEPLYSMSQQGKNLKPGHYGCFNAFKKAITEDFTDDYDYVIVCERDCIIETDINSMKDLILQAQIVMESNEDIKCFTFGDKVDLDHGNLQSPEIRKLGDFAYATNKIIGLQCIMFNKKNRDFLKQKFKEVNWYGMDIWLNVVFGQSNSHFGILNERATTQLDGYSIIDQENKNFKMNEK